MFKVGDKVRLKRDNGFKNQYGRQVSHNEYYSKSYGDAVWTVLKVFLQDEEQLLTVHNKPSSGIYSARFEKVASSNIKLNTRKKY